MKSHRKESNTYIAAGASTALCRSFDRTRTAKGLIRAVLSIVTLTASLAAPLVLHAQTVSFAGAQITLPASELNIPIGVAVDGAGDVFIADSANNRVVELPWTGGGYGAQITVPANGLENPQGVAVDGAGDLFIADSANNRVVELPWTGSSYGAQITVQLPTYFLEPSGVAVDGAGDLFISTAYAYPFDKNLKPTNVMELPWTASGYGSPITVASGLSYCEGVAVDGKGDIFIADTGDSLVVEVPWTGSGYGSQTPLQTSGVAYPWGVAVDGTGDVFIADLGINGAVEMPWTGSSYGAQISVPTNGVVEIYDGVAVDTKGDIFFANGTTSVLKFMSMNVNLGSADVCPAGQSTPAPCNQTATLNYAINDSTTIGAVNVVTQGAPNLDFTLSSTTCAGAQTAGSSCTVTANFAPSAPGLRTGAVQLTDTSGNVLATTLIYGTGQEPLISFGPGTQTTVPAGGLNSPQNVAVDAAGDVFIADNDNNRVVQVLSNGSTQTLPASGLSSPQSVAVDGAGDVFIADWNNSRVVEVPWTGSGYGALTTLPTNGLSNPKGVAVDAAGDVFIADYFNNRVLELPWTGSSFGPQITLPANGLSFPYGVAVDGAGNVFIADSWNNRVVVLPLTMSGYGAQITVPVSGLNKPQSVAVDAAGDVFIADTGNDRVVEVPANSGTQITLPVNGLSWPSAVAVDGKGDVFIVNDTTPGQVLELQGSTTPSLSFVATAYGQTSSPQSFTIQNVGNQPLTAISPGLSIGANFEQVAGSGTPEDCSSSFSLTPGAECNVSISFKPTATGSIQSSAVLTDNALNGNPATQSIALSGTSQQATPTLTFNSISNQTYGAAPFAVSASSNSNGAITYSVVSGPATISGSTVTITGVGTVTLQASQAATTNYTAAAATTSFTASKASQAITFDSIGSPQPVEEQLAIAATASSGLPVSFTSQTPSICTVSGFIVTLRNTGTCTIQASQAGNADYAVAIPVSQSFTVAPR
jgi:sugar lactone lactonase YvrE